MTQNELSLLLKISDTLEKNTEELTSEVKNWKANSEQLEIELESSSLEISRLINALEAQKPILTELGITLVQSQNQVGELKAQLKTSMELSNNLEQSIEQLNKDLYQIRLSRNIWRIAAMVAGILAATGWTMILWYP